VLKADNLPPFCAVVTKSGNLNFLEPSGSVQACNVTALPFTFLIAAVQLAVNILLFAVLGKVVLNFIITRKITV